MAKIGRNDPCPCGSGQKYKKCCIGRTLVYSADGAVSIMDERTEKAKINLEKGYQCFNQGNESEALRYWQPLWEDYIRDELQNTAIDAFDSKIENPDIFNWFMEYPMVLQNTALTDTNAGKQLLEYCDTMLNRTTTEYLPEFKESIALGRVVALSRIGHDNEADKEFEKLSRLYPDYFSTYVEWSFHLRAIDKHKAREVLKLGLENCPDLEEQGALKEHLEYLHSNFAD